MFFFEEKFDFYVLVFCFFCFIMKVEIVDKICYCKILRNIKYNCDG